MQRAHGVGELGFVFQGGRSCLSHLYQSGCTKIMMPKNHHVVPDAVVINTAGGLTGGDQISLSVELQEKCHLRLATQTAERIYRSTGPDASCCYDFKIGPDASLEWMAQESIMFQGGRIERSIKVDMDGSSRLLLVEPVVLGRRAMGETVSSGSFRDKWRIFRDGELIFADNLRIHNFSRLGSKAALGGDTAFATLLFVSPDAEEKAPLVKLSLNHQDRRAGCSAWNDFLLVRMTAPDGAALRKEVMKLVGLITGRTLPRVWLM